MNGTCKMFWQNLDSRMTVHPVTRSRVVRVSSVVAALKKWRVGMEQFDGDLSGVQLQADLVLFDICNFVGLNEQERMEVLGEACAASVAAELD